MAQMFEAIWNEGKIIPKSIINIKDNAHLVVIVLDDNIKINSNWQSLRGKYRGKLSSSDEYINNKKFEKELEL
ncbi:MAG: hypothetical protein HQK79_21165 [Desulfobacterales bacterium]|nr:hypothetical protein [Desulfobacterales bacterium]